MSDTFYQSLWEPVEMPFPRIAIHHGSAPPLPAVVPPMGASQEHAYLRPFAADQLNSRLGVRLPAGQGRLKWSAALPAFMQPEFVLQSGDRILVQGPTQWQLALLADGRQLALGNKGDAPLAFLPGGAGFWTMDRNGYVISCGRNGESEYLCPAHFTHNYRRLLIRRQTGAFTVVSLSYGPRPRGAGEQWAVEKIGVGDVSKKDETGVLLDAHSEGMLLQRIGKLAIPAVDGPNIVLGTTGRLYLMDDSLHITRGLTGDFEPICLSLDESGRIYLIVQTGASSALWVVTQHGERLISFALPHGSQFGAVPPIVGYDHRIYLVGRDRAVAVSPEGRQLWEHETSEAPGGAVVTADHHLLISEGSDLAAFDTTGHRRVVYSAADERWRTPPVLTAQGEILAASDSHLVCLTLQ